MPPLTATVALHVDPPIPSLDVAQLIHQYVVTRLHRGEAGPISWTAGDPITRWAFRIVATDIGHIDYPELIYGLAGGIAWNHRGSVAEAVEVGGMTEREAERRLAVVEAPEVIGVDAFAELLGIRRARLYQLRSEDPAFPHDIGRGVYLLTAAEAYRKRRLSEAAMRRRG